MAGLIEKIERAEQLLKEIKIELQLFYKYPENEALNETPSLDFNKSIAEPEKSAIAVSILNRYEQLIGLVTPTVVEGIEFFVIEKNMAPELVIRIIEYACEQGKRSWQYINACLLGNIKDGVLTLDEYKRKQARRAETKGTSNKQGRSKFNNYVDTNRHDYGKMQQELIEQMLE